MTPTQRAEHGLVMDTALSGASLLTETIEDAGWRLDQMSWLRLPSAFLAEGIYLFRREAR